MKFKGQAKHGYPESQFLAMGPKAPTFVGITNTVKNKLQYGE